MSEKTYVITCDGKTVLEHASGSMEWSYPVGQGLVIDEVAYVVAKVTDGGSKVDVLLDHQGAHPELFCGACGGSLGVTTNKRRCDRKREGKCHGASSQKEEKV
jgi:hypothetical protein